MKQPIISASTMIYQGKNNEYFELAHLNADNFQAYQPMIPGTLQMLWFQSDNNQLTIDGTVHSFHNNEILCLSQYHDVHYDQIGTAKMLRFNAEFYCIINHDSQVGCKGVLYYTPAKIPVVRVGPEQLAVMTDAWDTTDMELEMKDDLQMEMLQIILKRILILCTRLYKAQGGLAYIDDNQNNLVREFNFLVDKNFKEQHSVAFYASLLHKAPKTITNAFKMIGEKSPSQIIHDRIVLEAKNLLHHSDKDISEIAYTLGYENVQHFSRFFKKQVGVAPTAYRGQQAPTVINQTS